MEAIQTLTIDPSIVTSLVLNGDISKMNDTQKVEYYNYMAQRMGLDPAAKPFDLLKLNGKQVLYYTRSGAQQLSKVHGVSHEVKERTALNDIYVVTARATVNETGRFSESLGAVNIKGQSGDNLCNAMMKAETKAKRRATLDLLGLGILDETEIETIPASAKETDERGRPKREGADMSKASPLEVSEHLTVNSITSEEKEIKKKKVTVYVVEFVTAEGEIMNCSTTKTQLFKIAEHYKENGVEVMIEWQQTDFGKGLLTICEQPNF